MKHIEISHEPVELYKILKFEGLVSSGGEAKSVIEKGLVRVNGKVETRKRKKMLSGDQIEFGSDRFLIQCKWATIFCCYLDYLDYLDCLDCLDYLVYDSLWEIMRGLWLKI